MDKYVRSLHVNLHDGCTIKRCKSREKHHFEHAARVPRGCILIARALHVKACASKGDNASIPYLIRTSQQAEGIEFSSCMIPARPLPLIRFDGRRNSSESADQCSLS